jgi:hypothetical protein
MDLSENRQRMAKGELYYAFTPDLSAARARCSQACARYAAAGALGASRRTQIELFREYVTIAQSASHPNTSF